MATTRTHPAAVHRRVRLLSDCQLGKVYNFCSPLLDTHAKERCSVHTSTSSLCSTSYPNALVQTVVPPHLQELLLHTSQGCSEVSVRVEPVFLKWHDALRLLFSNFFIRSILFRINWNSKRLSWCWHSRNELRPKCRKWWCASSIKGGASQQGTEREAEQFCEPFFYSISQRNSRYLFAYQMRQGRDSGSRAFFCLLLSRQNAPRRCWWC